jgi:hypothetical protein
LYESAEAVAHRRQIADHLGHWVNAGGALAFIAYMTEAMDINS